MVPRRRQFLGLYWERLSRVYRHKETKSERSVKVASHHGHVHQKIPFLSIGVNKLSLYFPVLESQDLQQEERLWNPHWRDCGWFRIRTLQGHIQTPTKCLKKGTVVRQVHRKRYVLIKEIPCIGNTDRTKNGIHFQMYSSTFKLSWYNGTGPTWACNSRQINLGRGLWVNIITCVFNAYWERKTLKRAQYRSYMYTTLV